MSSMILPRRPEKTTDATIEGMERKENRFRVLIYGWGKTGTTALYYKMLGAFDEREAHGVFEPKGRFVPDWERDKRPILLVKALWHGVTLEDYPSYKFFDRRVWTVRDPRDFMISMYLYHWNSRKKDRRRIELVLNRLRRKETAPASIPFRTLVEDPTIGVETLGVSNMRRLRTW